MKIDLKKLYIGDVFTNNLFIPYINTVISINKRSNESYINIFYSDFNTLKYLPHNIDGFTYTNLSRDDN